MIQKELNHSLNTTGQYAGTPELAMHERTKGRLYSIIIILVLNVLRLLLYINCYLLLMYSLELPKTCLVAEEGALYTCIP